MSNHTALIDFLFRDQFRANEFSRIKTTLEEIKTPKQFDELVLAIQREIDSKPEKTRQMYNSLSHHYFANQFKNQRDGILNRFFSSKKNIDKLIQTLDDHIHIGDYVLTKLFLGKGTTSEVYLGIHKQNGDRVAIKIVNLNRLNSSQRDRIRQETEMMKRAHHENIVRLYESHEILGEGTLYLILENCEDGTLQDYLKETGRLSELEAQEITLHMATAFGILQKNKIVHRDIKPANLLRKRNKDGKMVTKLADFGTARELAEGQFAETFCGTPLYFAPEIADGRYTDKADLWSIGVILYEMLFGTLPFGGNSILELFANLKKKVVYPQDIHISPAAKDLLDNLLRLETDRRISWSDFFKHEFLGYPSLNSSLDDFVNLLPTPEEQLASYKKQLDDAERLIASYKSRVETAETSIRSLENQVRELKTSNANLLNSEEDEKRQHQSIVDDLIQITRIQNRELEKARGLISNGSPLKSRDETKLLAELETAKAHRKEADERIEILKGQISKKEEDQRTCDDRLSKALDNVSGLVVEKKQLENLILKKDKEISVLTRDLKELRTNFRDLFEN
eukprot:TRINITY_DN13338_c0_g1_i1.p1 TRINITY_DN13338_c0_g1~~TRINITY_DN13338_c0_g1_i1.p1  ORF type:complete len:568 (-),score=125.52 TRINITY_DN13338_c0_g1_i1:138-1841(-)